jgi:hypothetical protein
MADGIRIFNEGVDKGLVSTLDFVGLDVEIVSVAASGRKVGRVTVSSLIENRISDPSDPAVGQMWLRTDL